MIVRRRDAVIAEPVGAASASLNGLTAHGRPPYERTDECVEDRRTANRGPHSPGGNNDRSKTGWRYVSCCRKTVDRGSPDPHGVFSFHARRARRPTPATAGRENPRGRSPDGTRARSMDLPSAGKTRQGIGQPLRTLRRDAPCVHFANQEDRRSSSPGRRRFSRGGRYGESPSFRSWPRRAAPVPPPDDGRQPARSIGLAIGFRGTRDCGFGLQDTCPHAGTIPASRPGPLNAACAKKRRVSHGRSDDDSGSVQPLQSRPTRGGRSQ